MRYHFRTLLIALAFLPPMMAIGWWSYAAWRAQQEREQTYRAMVEALYAPRRLPNLAEPAEIYAWLLPRLPMVTAIVAVALFISVAVVAVSSHKWEKSRRGVP
jgi:hypothetical protein